MKTFGKTVNKVFTPNTIHVTPVKNVLIGNLGTRASFHMAESVYRVYKVEGIPIPRHGADWLTALNKAGEQKNPDFKQQTLDAFGNSSSCGIVGCKRSVEVGIPMTFSGDELLIVPCCQWHNSPGALNHARIKAYQIYASILLHPDDVLISHEDGTFAFGRSEM